MSVIRYAVMPADLVGDGEGFAFQVHDSTEAAQSAMADLDPELYGAVEFSELSEAAEGAVDFYATLPAETSTAEPDVWCEDGAVWGSAASVSDDVAAEPDRLAVAVRWVT